jgi:hypothetical protein|tara:strand:- start:8277 stop:8927 length:651 start_codon:yes stop_codon:yes gene_type:complete
MPNDQLIEYTKAGVRAVAKSVHNANTNIQEIVNSFYWISGDVIQDYAGTPVISVSTTKYTIPNDLMSTINQALDVLFTYLVDEDKESFNDHHVQIKLYNQSTPEEKHDYLRRIRALVDQLESTKFNFESKQGGLDDEQVSAWYTVKFWLLSTFKSMLNAVGLHSTASFFRPAPSDGEQHRIDENLDQLQNVVAEFNNIITALDHDSELETDSAHRI